MAVVLASPSAGGQARLLESTPEDGANLQVLETISFEFDSLLLADGAEVAITRTNGQMIAVSDIEVDGAELRARPAAELTSGEYEISYIVRSADGSENRGSIQIGVDAPSQALSGGLLAVIGIFFALFTVMFVVFYADKRRRPARVRPDAGRG